MDQLLRIASARAPRPVALWATALDGLHLYRMILHLALRLWPRLLHCLKARLSHHQRWSTAPRRRFLKCRKSQSPPQSHHLHHRRRRKFPTIAMEPRTCRTLRVLKLLTRAKFLKSKLLKGRDRDIGGTSVSTLGTLDSRPPLLRTRLHLPQRRLFPIAPARDTNSLQTAAETRASNFHSAVIHTKLDPAGHQTILRIGHRKR